MLSKKSGAKTSREGILFLYLERYLDSSPTRSNSHWSSPFRRQKAAPTQHIETHTHVLSDCRLRIPRKKRGFYLSLSVTTRGNTLVTCMQPLPRASAVLGACSEVSRSGSSGVAKPWLCEHNRGRGLTWSGQPLNSRISGIRSGQCTIKGWLRVQSFATGPHTTWHQSLTQLNCAC